MSKSVALAGITAAAVAAIGVTAAALAAATHSDDSVIAATQDDQGKELLAQRCISCHAIETVTARRASAEEWHEIIDRMVMNGAQVTGAEVEAIVSYLASHYGPQSASAESLAPSLAIVDGES